MTEYEKAISEYRRMSASRDALYLMLTAVVGGALGCVIVMQLVVWWRMVQ